MNDEIRATVDSRLKAQGMTRADLARATKKHPNSITRALNGYDNSGRVSPLWEEVLNVLGLKLVAVSIDSAEERNENELSKNSPRI